ncbi:MAG TPA: hypothetical protein VIU11_12225, partial [Nakamurella sp.]
WLTDHGRFITLVQSSGELPQIQAAELGVVGSATGVQDVDGVTWTVVPGRRRHLPDHRQRHGRGLPGLGRRHRPGHPSRVLTGRPAADAGSVSAVLAHLVENRTGSQRRLLMWISAHRCAVTARFTQMGCPRGATVAGLLSRTIVLDLSETSASIAADPRPG